MLLAGLKKRATVLAKVREFFANLDVLEVDTPLLASAPVTDPYLDTFAVDSSHGTKYLQTSPEYAMKRLLSLGVGSMYQICKAFRVDEVGRHHNPEFTMLEWYRVGFSDVELINEVDALLQFILATEPADKITYKNLFLKYLNINPHTVKLNTVQSLLKKHIGQVQGLNLVTKDDCLQLLLSEFIEPKIGLQRPVVIYDYPVSQAALAKIKKVATDTVAARFEFYYKGIELANGYHELTDYHEQKQRFVDDLAKRKQIGAQEVPIDVNFLQAIEHGLPDCAGVALGFDRLCMLALESNNIKDVLSFDFLSA